MGNKHVHFGKDIGLMAEVVRRGLSVGIGNWEFWQPLSKSQPGLWKVMHDFFGVPPEQYFRWCESWKSERSKTHRLDGPDLDTLDAVVRFGRENVFGKKEWEHLTGSASVFAALVDYLRLAPPFAIPVTVDYSHIPPYMDDYTPDYPLRRSSGSACVHMSIHMLSDDKDIATHRSRIEERGWRFADQQEVYAFGQATRRCVRPWAIMGHEPLYALGSCRLGNGYYHFPRLWMLRGNSKLDPHGCAAVVSQFRNNMRAVIVNEQV